MRPETRDQSLRARAQRALEVVRRIVGIPDYTAYIEHMNAHHPAETPLTSEAFLQKCWEDKYSRPGHRCC